MKAFQGRNSVRRVLAVLGIGAAPCVALAWASGCSSEGDGPSGTYVDLGGTYGAEVSVTVVGPGRVTMDGRGIDCPSQCFTKYVFDGPEEARGATGITLTATPTVGARFKGWSFETEELGTRGRGPEACNPVKRPGGDPGGDKASEKILLPYGETNGTPPPGQEAACNGHTAVPLAYKVVATFETIPVVDSGVDAGDDDVGEVLFEAPVVGAEGREIGITQNGSLYWHFRSAGQSGIAYSSSPASAAPQTPQVIVSPGTTINVFEVDATGVVYQESTVGSVKLIPAGATTPISMGAGLAASCMALSVDQSANVYCRTSDAIYGWQSADSYSAPTVLYTDVGSGGPDLLVETAAGPIYYSTPTSIASLSLPVPPDAGAATPTTVLSGTSSSTHLESNGARFYWTEFSQAYASSGKLVGATRHELTPMMVLGFPVHVSADAKSSSHFWVADPTSIHHAYYAGTDTKPFKTELVGLQGLASDLNYVYWSTADGRVWRAERSAF